MGRGIETADGITTAVSKPVIGAEDARNYFLRNGNRIL